MRAFLIIALFLIKISLSFGQNQNLSNGVVFDGEPYLAIDPDDSQHIVISWMGFQAFNYIVIKTKVSFDGGQTWSSTNHIPHTNPNYGSADPSLAYDNSGNVFLSYIDYDAVIDSGAVYIRKSTDGGLSWGEAIEVINAHDDPGKYPIDRPWMSIDRSGGIYNNSIYVTTMNPKVFGYIPPPYNPYFMRSTDGGNSFETWRYLDTLGWLAGSIITNPYTSPTMSNDGVFYGAYPSWVFSQNINPQYILVSSEDGGDFFNYKSIFDFSGHEAVLDTLAKKGYILISNPADEAHLVFLWLLNDNGDSDIFLWESFDGGDTWSILPQRINDDPIGNKKQQDLVWADFDTDGDIVVTWRDRRNAPDTTFSTSAEIWGACRNKDSLNFSSNFLISSTLVAYDTILANPGNDFMCVKLRNDTLHAVWGDTRDGMLNVWYQRMSCDGIILSIQELSSENIPEVSIYPNPSVSTVSIEGENLHKVLIINENGKLVLKKENLNNVENLVIDLKELPPGIYFVQVTLSEGIITKKVIKH